MIKRLTLLDDLLLRDTSVYRNPRDISVLQHLFGDMTGVRVPCTPLDESGIMHHASDGRMMSINNVYVEGEPVTFGYQAHTAYQDETGQAIACVVFDNPQYDKQVSISGKGNVHLTTGALIENPADLIEHIMLNIQGYDAGSIDAGVLAQFRADCLKEEIVVAVRMNEVMGLRAWLDDLAKNIQSRWAISDGKSVMKLKWL